MEVEINYLAIGKRIRTARLSKKMTQETLSNMIDVAPTYVSSIENGHTKLSLATLLGIAQSLDTTVDQLLYDNTPVLVSKFDADIKELVSRIYAFNKSTICFPKSRECRFNTSQSSCPIMQLPDKMY